MITALTQNQLVMTEPKPTAPEILDFSMIHIKNLLVYECFIFEHSELEHIVILYDLCSLGIIQRRVL